MTGINMGMGPMARLLLAALAALMMAAPANAWWNKEWTYRKPVMVDTTASGVNISGAVGRTLVLVRLHSGNFTFTEALENGADIRIVDADDKTPLPYHIEKYDAQNGLATLWVSVPNLNGGEKKQLWLYFGNQAAPAGGDAKGSFDPDYQAVYHFGEGPGQPSEDSTANANNAQNGPPGVNDSAVIGRGARFPGQGAVTIAATPSLAIPAGAPFTLSLWVKPDQLAGEQAVFGRGPMVVGLNAGTPFVAIGPGRASATNALKQGEWAHLAVVADAGAIRIYVNGVEVGAASAALPALDGPLSIGGAEGRAFTGEIDEVRLSKAARPASMILAMANAEGPSGKLVTVAETAEKQGGHGSGVIPFIVSKLEPIDTGVVVICLLLLAGAIAVMVMKLRYLNNAQRGNDVFLKRFREMNDDMVPVAQTPGISEPEVKFILQSSPIGRLYEVGIEEMEIRRRNAPNRPLSGEAISAMRAVVDSQVVTENQKFDSAMVLLTIAISGGPFIGLLGTVIGVMSTFGGVAMAGDVNVNAIAPGIAAALLATIAGLAAAIPSLFGYNYLNGRISAMSDELRVFVDRLITRLAEIQADAAYAPPPERLAAE